MPATNGRSGAGDLLPTAGFRQLHIELQGVKPAIWRRLLVPADANLGWLHAVIQTAMGWTNSHLHQYYAGDKLISDPTFALKVFEDDPPVLDEGKVRIDEVLNAPGQKLMYEYDFGDSWGHVITLEAVSQPGLAIEKKAVCIDGAQAAPPEDCGGVPGYEQLLNVLKNKKHPEHKAMKQWLGGPFDPESFSLRKTNPWLAKLRWPRVTQAALRKVLMARDASR
ncbi:MAG: plasmid pRiA4b ORF-3 family protein [Verrucomicrobiota bacterium]